MDYLFDILGRIAYNSDKIRLCEIVLQW